MRAWNFTDRLGAAFRAVCLVAAVALLGGPAPVGAQGQGGGQGGGQGKPPPPAPPPAFDPPPPPPVVDPAACNQTLTAEMVVLDQVVFFNRLGAHNENWIVYALARDVVAKADLPPAPALPLIAANTPLNQVDLTVQANRDLLAGNVMLRPDKRPRPPVLRVADGDCLEVTLTNLLSAVANPNPNVLGDPAVKDDQVAGRFASFHPLGMEVVNGIDDDGSFVGQNPNNSTIPSGGRATYKYRANGEGTRMVYSLGQPLGSEGTGGNIGLGMFAVVNIEPKGAKFYRSQLTEEEFRLAHDATGNATTPTGQPQIDYEVLYPGGVWAAEGKAGLPVINMVTAAGEIVHTDINAIIAGPCADGSWECTRGTANAPYPLERTPAGLRNPTVPNRLEAFREFTVVFHDEAAATNAFPAFYQDPVMHHTLHGVRDAFMINFGSGGIGTEIIANRLRVGPMHDCLTCAYEEFFLTSFTVGDPAMLVDVPANVGLENCGPGPDGNIPANLQNCPVAAMGPKANLAKYPDDPSNVHHSYTSDFVKFRNLHAGPKEQHVFHLHNHQWLFNANDDNSNYLDAQGIGPGSGYTYEINFGGSGNRNKTAGDAIFHCHFYPHFAQGMWELWRVHDTLETGTLLAASGGGFHATPFALEDGVPAANARALPDGEILVGTPIPAVVPLPAKAMAPLPGKVTIVTKDADGDLVPESSQAVVDRTDVDPALITDLNPSGLKNPGYPFWIAGIEDIVGQRPPTPPTDMLSVDAAAALMADPTSGFDHPGFAAGAGGHDGGLPRHSLEGYAAGGLSADTQNRLDFTKTVTRARPKYFPEIGTDVEMAVMSHHAQADVTSSALLLGGGVDSPVPFLLNGNKPAPSAPYMEPCIDDDRELFMTGQQGDFFDAYGGHGTKGTPEYGAEAPRVYKAAVIQMDAVFNKVGYHFPQQRIISLWHDAAPMVLKEKPPEPFVMRLNTYDCATYHHTNLVPALYELDDYQVRTPTDIIGQHIHLPKWDLTVADGSGNGWNYEDGTLSPGTVIERIEAINAYNGSVLPVDQVATLPPPNPTDPLDCREQGGDESSTCGGLTHLEPADHPFFKTTALAEDAVGARVTLQRWFADPVVNVDGVDRGLGIIFTHDHFGPSTHQQVGLYSTVLTEPAGSTWVHNETGEPLYTRDDGGPTTWQAAILVDRDDDGDGENDSFREFYFEYADFQHAYEPGVYVGAGQDGRPFNTSTAEGFVPDPETFRFAINPSVREEAGPVFPDLLLWPPDCPGGVPRPCPEAISADDPGMYVTNYRNEPIALRVYDPAKLGPDGKPGTQADGLAGDLAHALQSREDRVIPEMNVQPAGGTSINGTVFPPPINAAGVRDGDPFTPMARAQAGDIVRVKVQSGATEEEHNVSFHGLKWLNTGSGHGTGPNSGWKNSQEGGISEQFTFRVPLIEPDGQAGNIADYAYTHNASQEGWWQGPWGILRTYSNPQRDLYAMPNGLDGNWRLGNRRDFDGVCPVGAVVREFDLTAVLANEVLDNPLGVAIVPVGDPLLSDTMHEGGPLDPNGGTLVYNSRPTPLFNGKSGPLHDPTGILYVHTADLILNPDGILFDPNADPCADDAAENRDCPVALAPGTPIEPVVLRAQSGECIQVRLRNRLPAEVATDVNGDTVLVSNDVPDLAGFSTLVGLVARDRFGLLGMTSFNNNLIQPSPFVGIRPQLVAYDVTRADGSVVGQNPDSLVQPGDNRLYTWYAGDLSPTNKDKNSVDLKATPVEFGGAGLMPADHVKQGQKGMVGALIIEPALTTAITEDADTRTAATVETTTGSFRDFAVVFQKGTNQRYSDGTAIEGLNGEGVGVSEDAEDAGQYAINYGSEPLWFRFGLAPNAHFGNAGAPPPAFGSVPNPEVAFHNSLAGGADPETGVFTATAGDQVRVRTVVPHGTGRGTTVTIHGHAWQRDPYACGGSSHDGLLGKCAETEVGSRAIGENPSGMRLGHQESVLPAAHFDMVLPSAGGSFAKPGDYLIRDQGSFGTTQGLWTILRVEPTP